MDIRAHEASRGGHLPEGVGEVMGPFVAIIGVVHFKIHPPSHSNKIGVFPKGFLMALLEEPHQMPPFFLPLAGSLFGSDL